MPKGNKAVEADELEGIDFEETEGTDAEEKEKPVKKAASAKSGKKAVAKAAKPAKVKKTKVAAEEEDDEEAPEEVGRWPFKKSSLMRWAFQSAYDGIKRQEFDETIKKLDKNPKVFLKVLQNGKNGQKTGVPTHSWSLSEEGGRLKISNVKYYGVRSRKAVEAKAAKKATKAVAKKAGAKKKAKAAA